MEKNIIKIIVILTLILCTSNILLAENNNNVDFNTRNIEQNTVENLEQNENIGTIFASRKDPFLAGFYAFLMMGAGHFYTGNYQTGSFFLFSDLMLKTMLVGLILHFKAEYTTETKTSIEWKELNVTDKSLLVGYVLVYCITLIFNISDAVKSAHEYNRRYLSEPSLQIGFGASSNNINIALSTRF